MSFDFEHTTREMLQNYGISASSIDTILRTHAQEIAADIKDEFPDPNPLASLFGGYVVASVAEYISGKVIG